MITFKVTNTVATLFLLFVLLSGSTLEAQFYKNSPFYGTKKNVSKNMINIKIPQDIELEASLNRFPSKQNYIFFRTDLDGNGKPDVIDFRIFGKDRELFELRVNNTSLKKFIDANDITLRIIDLNPQDKIKEIMIQINSPLDQRNSHKFYFIKYLNHKLSYIGLYRKCDGANFTGNHLQILTDMKWWVKKERYFLNQSHILNKVKDEFLNVDVTLRLVKQLPILKKRKMNVPIYYVPAGNKISVLFYTIVDKKEWYVIQYHNDMLGFTTAQILEECAGLENL
ncbi:hypothetical protein KAJ27_07180 [bacterium]|nr:hypothetical protein [bacterium]